MGNSYKVAQFKINYFSPPTLLISQDRKGQLMTNQQHHSNEWIFNITIN